MRIKYTRYKTVERSLCDFSQVELVELRAFFVGTEILVQIFGSVRRFPCSSF